MEDADLFGNKPIMTTQNKPTFGGLGGLGKSLLNK